ncbi:MAG TPA: hypothetical protein VJ345_03705 [Anaerolineales bacterium]|nr:hypothetical protein [Anaerolineales bacterium]
MSQRLRPAAVLFTLALFALACGRGTAPTAPATTQPTAVPPPATPTPFPTPPPPANTPSALPSDSQLRALIEYANAMQPLIVQAGATLQRDAVILQEAEDGNDEVLCDGRLEADNSAMKGVLEQVRAVEPPADGAAIHDLVVRSGDAWTEALDNVERFCSTGNALYKVPAGLKFWEAALLLQDAGNRFWSLMMAEGVEDWVRR